jgi:hypothetical protein
MPDRSLGIFDITVDIIPGAALIIILSILPPADVLLSQVTIGQSTASVFEAFIFISVSFAIGHFIQGVGSSSYLTSLSEYFGEKVGDEDPIKKKPFQAAVKENVARGHTIEEAFIQAASQFFNFEIISDRGTERSLDESKLDKLYWLLRSYLYNNNITRGERQLTLLIFFRSMWVVFVLSFGVYLLYVLVEGPLCYVDQEWCMTLPVRALVLGMILVIFPVGMTLSYYREKTYGERMAMALIDDFYTSTVKDLEINNEVPLRYSLPTPYDVLHDTTEGEIRIHGLSELEELKKILDNSVAKDINNGLHPSRAGAIIIFYSTALFIIDELMKEIIQRMIEYEGTDGQITVEVEDLSYREGVIILREHGVISSGVKGQLLDTKQTAESINPVPDRWGHFLVDASETVTGRSWLTKTGNVLASIRHLHDILYYGEYKDKEKLTDVLQKYMDEENFLE